MNNPIINLTQHAATPEQAAAGVRDLPAALKARLVALLTFEDLPVMEDVLLRAAHIAELAVEAADGFGSREWFGVDAMIGGAPFLMAPLEAKLVDAGICPTYAFSRRESVQPDGSVRKTAAFRHAGFVDACIRIGGGF